MKDNYSGRRKKSIIEHVNSKCKTTSFLSFSLFLKGVFLACRSQNHRFTYKDLSELFGLSRDNNYLYLVIRQRRVITFKHALNIIETLQIKKDEKEYGLLIFELETSRDSHHKAIILEKLTKLKKSNVKGQVDQDLFEHWLNTVVGQLLRLGNFDKTPEGIQDRLIFKVRIEEIRATLDFLHKQKVIRYDEKTKTYENAQKNFSWNSDWEEFDYKAIAGYLHHQQMLLLSLDSLTRINAERRVIVGSTVALSDSAIDELKEEICCLIEKAHAKDEADQSPTELYQLNIQFFPFTK